MDERTHGDATWEDLDSVVPGAVGVHADDGFVHVSEAFARIVGVETEDLAGESWQSLFPQSAVDRLDAAIETARREGQWEGTAPLDGDRTAASVLDLTLSVAESGAVIWVATESDRERERELARYETIVETVEDGIYVLDEDLRFSFVNEAFCDLFGVDREAVIGRDAGELFDEEGESEATATVREQLLATDDRTGTIRGTFSTPAGERVMESRYRLSPEPDGEFRGCVGVVRDVTAVEQLEAELREERQFVENVVDALDDVLYVVDEDGAFAFWNQELCDRFGYDDEEVPDLEPNDFLTPAESDELPADPSAFVDVPDRHNVVDLATKSGESIPHELHGVTYTDETTGKRYRVGIGRDITGRLRRERALEHQRDQLATLDRVNELLLETVRALVRAEDRDAVERTICERLAASELYQFAWVGEREFDGDRILPRVSAGEDDGYLDATTITADRSETGGGPAGEALRTGEVQVADVTDPAFEPWQEAATERGLASVAAVPLYDGETVHGVLVVYATREDAFGPRERAGFDVIGRTVGAVIEAARSRELLFADAVVELTFRVADTDALVARTAGDLNCEIDLEGYIPSGDQWVLYCTVAGATPEEVVATVSADDRIERARTISENGDGGRVELVAAEASLPHAVTDAGGTLRSVVADADGAEIVVEAPADADVRGLVEEVRTSFPGVEFLARRECNREVTTVGQPGGPLDELTGRQREVLEAAYRAGYFDWPRESTAEEVARSVDLAASTLHGHLRKAEQAILSALLDD
jgi:PAS domain S-box-containing protein